MRRNEEIEELERRFPELAVSAFARARARALSAGLSVVEAQDGLLCEVFPDGRRKIINPVEPPQRLVWGSRLILP